MFPTDTNRYGLVISALSMGAWWGTWLMVWIMFTAIATYCYPHAGFFTLTILLQEQAASHADISACTSFRSASPLMYLLYVLYIETGSPGMWMLHRRVSSYFSLWTAVSVPSILISMMYLILVFSIKVTEVCKSVPMCLNKLSSVLQHDLFFPSLRCITEKPASQLRWYFFFLSARKFEGLFYLDLDLSCVLATVWSLYSTVLSN